jgi:xylan 1,4-beta-xylosidase
MKLSTKINTTNKGTPLPPTWNLCVGAGRANEALRAGWLEQLALAKEHGGFRYCRFHGIFHDDMFVYRIQDGREVWNWQYVDDVFDRMLDFGVKPFVELAFCPKDLARAVGTVFWWKGNGSPPKDWEKWAELVRRFTEHCIERYGLDEVLTWYFEVWNEPNLDAFFQGTRTEYFELYRHSVNAVKSVNSALRVGGPSSSVFVMDDRFDGETWNKDRVTPSDVDLDTLPWHPVWVREFLDFCTREKLPVDFIATHPYPTETGFDEYGKKAIHMSRSRDSLLHDMTQLREILDTSAYPEAEIHCTEWSTSPLPRDYMHDHLPVAAYLVRANLQVAHLVDSLSYWVFTDIFEESGAGHSIFHGGFGMINFQGIPKPAFHAYRFLNQLGETELARDEHSIVTLRADGRIAILIWNYPDDFKSAPHTAVTSDGWGAAEAVLAAGTTRAHTLHLTDLPSNCRFTTETLDEQHGFALRTWQVMGQPEPPTREQTKTLKEAAWALAKSEVDADASGTLNITRTLAPWAVELLVSEAPEK